MSIIETLTEGMVHRNMQQEGAALLNKWSQTGLLEGLSNDEQKSGMARLLENQARELLRESNTMAGGDVEGFAAVAFPIVRRVFAGLIANDLVSVQPMSLPSGLIFFMDFTFSDTNPTGARSGQNAESLYGQGRIASEITGGVLLNNETMDLQPYGLGSAYSSPTGSKAAGAQISAVAFDGFTTGDTGAELLSDPSGPNNEAFKAIKWDADVLGEFSAVSNPDAGYLLSLTVARSEIETTPAPTAAQSVINMKLLSQIVAPLNLATTDAAALTDSAGSGVTVTNFTQVRRLTTYDVDADAFTFYYVCADDASKASAAVAAYGGSSTSVMGKIEFPMIDSLVDGGALGSVVGNNNWGLEDTGGIPEIDIKVDSIAITAVTKKLKAKWTPELGQDLNAYHNLDAEVELTSILSEQIALEIDREILSDLINGATAGTLYWSRAPGRFVNRLTGAEIGANTATPDFTGTVSEWYETLIETINDVSAQIHRKTLRGGANFCVVSPEVANVLEFTAGFRANVTADADKGDIGAVKVGSLNRKFDVIVDPYFPRNAILVGRKGSSFLESGYVYAPYVPLQTTPTIFGPDDFVPRKGVMTRYGKKMVRPDMYGLVIVRDLLGASDGGQ
jgi:hypothetical protein